MIEIQEIKKLAENLILEEFERERKSSWKTMLTHLNCY